VSDLTPGSAGIPARHERESAKTKKRIHSRLNDGASSLSVLAHASAGRDARAPGEKGRIHVNAALVVEIEVSAGFINQR
jgi:hypothetical protein